MEDIYVSGCCLMSLSLKNVCTTSFSAWKPKLETDSMEINHLNLSFQGEGKKTYIPDPHFCVTIMCFL